MALVKLEDFEPKYRENFEQKDIKGIIYQENADIYKKTFVREKVIKKVVEHETILRKEIDIDIDSHKVNNKTDRLPTDRI